MLLPTDNYDFFGNRNEGQNDNFRLNCDVGKSSHCLNFQGGKREILSRLGMGENRGFDAQIPTHTHH